MAQVWSGIKTGMLAVLVLSCLWEGGLRICLYLAGTERMGGAMESLLFSALVAGLGLGLGIPLLRRLRSLWAAWPSTRLEAGAAALVPLSVAVYYLAMFFSGPRAR